MSNAALRSIPIFTDDSPVRLAGVLDATPGRHGRVLSRLAPSVRHQVADPAIDWMASLPSGARLEFDTDATTLEVEAVVTRVQWDRPSPVPVDFDLVVDGELVAGRTVATAPVVSIDETDCLSFERVDNDPATVRFDGLAPRSKSVQVWLPHNSPVELIDLRVDAAAAVNAYSVPERRRWVHYGSSISHCGEALRPTEVWPSAVAIRNHLDLISLAIAGQAHVDQFAARSIRDLVPAPDVVSLKIGINVVNGDTMRERSFVPAVHGFLDTIRDGLPDAPIVVVTPIICPAAERHPGPTTVGTSGSIDVPQRPAALADGALSLERIRELLATIVATRRDAGDVNLHLRSGLDLFGSDDVDELPDGLHPSPVGYLTIAERFHHMAFAPGGMLAQPISARFGT